MSDFKLLIIEDDPNEVEDNYKPTLKRIEKERNIKIDCTMVPSREEAFAILDSTFDGAIVDLKLDSSGEEKGNDVIREIHAHFRIPVAVLTGTPKDLGGDLSGFVKVFTRDQGLDAALGYLLEIYSTGLTKIMGGRGLVEEAMGKIFWESIHPHIETWVRYSDTDTAIEKAMLRYVVSNLQEILDDSSAPAYPEEVYISKAVSGELKTGRIVSDSSGNFYIVVSPACDLVSHNGQCKTDRIHVCEIEKLSGSNIKRHVENLDNDEKKEQARSALQKITENSGALFNHYLPKTGLFEGGVVNFRKIISMKPSEFKKQYEDTGIQISMPFVKDIIARLSSYYARQGQPAFDSHALTEQLIAHVKAV